MKTIQVQVIEETDIARQYDATFYPSDGLYFWTCNFSLVSVVNGQVLFIGLLNDWSPLVTTGQYIGSTAGESISADILLKAIAVAQMPELIKEI